MDYFSVNNEGFFYDEILDTLPEWTSDDEGREIYVLSDDRRYYGSSTGWVKYLTRDDAVFKVNFDANTILKADTNDLPVTLTVGTNTIVGRYTGSISALTPTQVRTIINVENGADVTDYDNVSLAGAVMETAFDANTILKADTDDSSESLTINPNEILGRYTGEINSLSAEDVRDILNLEDGADVTTTLAVSAAGALMKTKFGANMILKADVDDIPVSLLIQENRILSRYGSYPISGSTAEQIRDILNVGNNADMTDYDNVSLAGAVMETSFDANTILKADVDDTPITLTVGTNTIVGRYTGNISALTPTDVRTIINVEDGADVTDAVNIASSVHGVAEKTITADDDEFAIIDSADSYSLKKIKASNLFNIGTYYDLSKSTKTDDYSVLTTDENTIIELNYNSDYGDIVYDTPGTYSWTAPDNVTSVCVVCIGGGAGACDSVGGGGGGLGWKNNITVIPGNSYTVVVGVGGRGETPYLSNFPGGDSYFIGTSTVCGYGGNIYVSDSGSDLALGGSYTGDGGGDGGYSDGGNDASGGGGAGGYSGNGGNGFGGSSGGSGSGGGGGGGACGEEEAGGGGGVGLFGEGNSGSGGVYARDGGGGGSNGADGADGDYGGGGDGGDYGGGGGGVDLSADYGGDGAGGAVRIVWGDGRYFPSTNVDENYSLPDKTFTLPSVGSSDDGKMFFFMNSCDAKLIIKPSDSDSIWNSGAGYGIELPDKGTYVALRYDHANTKFDIIQKTGGRVIVEGLKFHIPMNRMYHRTDKTFDGVNTTNLSDEATGNYTPLIYNNVVVLDETYAKFPPSCYNLVSSTGIDYIRLNTSTDWDLFGDQVGVKTLSGWIYKISGQTDDIIYFGEDACTYCLIKTDSSCGTRLQYFVDGLSQINTFTSYAFDLNTWTHIALIINGSNVGLYINGIQIAHDSSWSTRSFNGTLSIGGISSDFDGYMQDWFIAYSNPFNASPNSSLTDTFDVPTAPMQLVMKNDRRRR